MKIKQLFLFAVLLVLNIKVVDAVTNPYPKYSQYGPYNQNCTYFAWQQVYDKTGIALPGWGNANMWLNSAKKAGYEVGTIPKAKSIVVWKWDKYGHVGYVEKVSNGKIYAWDSDAKCTDQEDPDYKACLEASPSESGDQECYKKYGKTIACEYDAKYWSEPGDLIGYIYLDKIPTTNSSSSTKSPTKKSSNNNIKELIISNIDFSFNKNTLKYSLTTSLDKIKIEGTLEDDKAKVEGLGEYNLNLGNNTINIIVTAEDSTKKTYTLEINRTDNNTYLESLIISNLNFEFKSETTNYNINAPSNIDKITIEGKAISESSLIEGLGTYNLQEGNNEFNIIVTAEDKSTKTYKINILKEKENIINNTKKDNNKLLITGIIFGTIILSLIIFFITKKIIHKR